MTIALYNTRICAPDDKQNELLKNINLELLNGTVTLLIGHTGSGKSTLLQVLAGILEPASGNILLDGQPLWRKGKVDQKHLLRLGLTFQFPEQQLFAGSIRREFTYSLRPYKLGATERERRICAACEDFDPHGVFAMDRSPFALSGGEQRRLALATTFATAPDWLFMDEPTAGLEAAAVSELLRLIREYEIPRGGFVIATHDLDTFFPLADRVIVMDRGAIVADGSPAALCREPELLMRAGVGLPSCVEIAQSLAGCNIAIAPDRLTPELAAEAIAAVLLEREANVGCNAKPAKSAAPFGKLSASTAEPGKQSEKLSASTAEPAEQSEKLSVSTAEPAAPSERPTDLTAELAAPSAMSPPSTAKPAALALDTQAAELLSSAAVSSHKPKQAAWLRLDPRAKWLLYLLLVIGTMLQHQWGGLAAATVPVALVFIGLPRSLLRGAVKIAWPFLIFMVISVSLAGLQISTHAYFPISFSLDRAWNTMLNVTRLFIVIIAGYWLAATTPYGQLVQGLNWALKYFNKIKLPVDSFALAVSLIFRFIPLILREWQRFSTIVRARGKAPLRPGTVRARDIPALVVPLLLSMFYKAEEMTVAMEMKKQDGRHDGKQEGKPEGKLEGKPEGKFEGKQFLLKNHSLRWRNTDTALVIGGIICFGLVVFISGLMR